MTGRVVTFYSYKGGVGRSFALANVAVVLAQWGYRVLAVDWDIEAPGLNHYFSGRTDTITAGVIEFLDDCRTGKKLRWDKYVTPVELGAAKGDLKLMAAHAEGKRDYAAMVQDLDWDELYREHDLGGRLEELRAEWVEKLDFVLVDSRTGVTDFSGLTTVQLPDVLAFMFTANDQSLAGCANVARRAMEARRSMPVDRPAILPLPIPARFEQREEYDRAQQWRLRFKKELKPFFDTWAPPDTDLTKLIDLLTIPYVPRWTFGEELAVLLEQVGTAGVRSPSHQASFACETIAALLVQEFGKIDLLTSSRDEFVHGAQRRALETAGPSAAQRRPNLFAAAAAGKWSSDVIKALHTCATRRAMGMVSYVHGERVDIGVVGTDSIRHAISAADAYFVVVDGDDDAFGRGFIAEIDLIQRSALRSDSFVPIIPLVRENAEKGLYSTKLAHYRYYVLRRDRPLVDQLEPVFDHLQGLLLDRSP